MYQFSGRENFINCLIQVLQLMIYFNNTLFKYIYARKQDTRYVFEKADREVIPIKGPLTELKKKY